MAIRNDQLGGTDWSNGEILDATDVNDTFDAGIVQEEVGHQAQIDALYALSDAGGTLRGTVDNQISDVFIDADGFNNTVNTTNTTAPYITGSEHYIAGGVANGSPETDSRLLSPNNDGGGSISFTTTSTFSMVTSIRIFGNVGASYTVTVNLGGSTVVATKTGTLANNNSTGDLITFTASDYSRFLPPTGTHTCGVSISAGGKSRTGETYSGTLFSIPSSTYPASQTSTTNSTFSVDSVNAATAVVETNAQFGSGSSITKVFVSGRKEDDGTNLITYDASSDNGSTYTTGLSLDILNTLTSTTGNQLIIKFNMPADFDAELYGYSLKVVR